MAEYRLVPELPGYRVGSDGSVWSCWHKRGRGRGRPPIHFMGDPWVRLNPGRLKSGGALSVVLGRGNHRRVGRLVLETFVGPCPPGMECCHFPDPDPANCRLDNLRWGTSAENTEDQRRHGTLVGGERHGMAKLTNAEVALIKSLAGSMTQQALADRFGVSQGHISTILGGTRRTDSSHAGKGL